MNNDPPMRGLVCHDDVAAQRAIGVLMKRSGFTDPVVAAYASEGVDAAERSKPDAVVVDLAVTGDLGLCAIAAFHHAAPCCLVLCLSSFTALEPLARAAGALCLVDPRDLRHLEDWLLLGTDPDHPCH